MPGGDRCAVGGYNNGRRYKEKQVVRSHVSHLQFYVLPKDKNIRNRWVNSIEKGRVDFKPVKHKTVCSYHFVDAAPTNSNPVPTLFMTESGYLNSPKRRRAIVKSEIKRVKRKLPLEHEFLLVMMRLCLGHLTHDLALRFGISDTLTSSICFSPGSDL